MSQREEQAVTRLLNAIQKNDLQAFIMGGDAAFSSTSQSLLSDVSTQLEIDLQRR